jgi:hypothetical protein
LGTIAAATTFGIYTAKAVEAKQRYDDDTAQIGRDNADLCALQGVIDLLRNIDIMIDGVLNIIDKAMESLADIQILLANQAQGFKDIETNMKKAQGDIQGQDQIIRALVSVDMSRGINGYYKVGNLNG